MQPIKLNLSTPTAPPVAIDVTMLLAASSFIDRRDSADPRAGESFEAVATAFCNGSPLYVPLPSQAIDASPTLYQLWHRERSVTSVPHLEVDDAVFEETTKLLADHLAAFLDGESEAVSKWLAYHFTQDVVDQHLERSDLHAIERASALAISLVAKRKLTNLRKAFSKVGADRLRVPYEYEPLLGTARIPSTFHLGVAYALSVSVRGWAYAKALERIPELPIYRYHWIRSPTLRYVGWQTSPESRLVSEWIPWGTILRGTFDREKKPLSWMQDAMTALRAQSLETRLHLTQAAASPKSATRLSDDEILLLEGLVKAGVVPRYAEKQRVNRYVTWLRRLVKDRSLLWQLPVDLITANVQSRTARRIESRFRTRFRRDTFWDVFEDPGVRRALGRRSRGVAEK